MLRADMMENAVDAALENRKVTFNGVGVNVATHVFPGAMIMWDAVRIRTRRQA
jgi:hypothetical protein